MHSKRVTSTREQGRNYDVKTMTVHAQVARTPAASELAFVDPGCGVSASRLKIRSQIRVASK
jgi:hypothetical protein